MRFLNRKRQRRGRVYAVVAWPEKGSKFRVNGKVIKDTRILQPVHVSWVTAMVKRNGLAAAYPGTTFSCVELKVDGLHEIDNKLTSGDVGI